MAWTLFNDMHSGGGLKEKPYESIYIEADSEAEAVDIFVERFGHDPRSVACECCGQNYSIDHGATFLDVSWFERGCDMEGDVAIDRPSRQRLSLHPYVTEDQYLAEPDVLVVRRETR